MKSFEFKRGTEADKQAQDIIAADFISKSSNSGHTMVSADNVFELYTAMFRTFAAVLKAKISKKVKKIGLKLLNEKAEFIFGAILEYEEPEEDSEVEAGHWVLSFTVEEADIDDSDDVVDCSDPMVFAIANAELYHTCYGNYVNSEAQNTVFVNLITAIKEFLESNANDGEEAEFTVKDIFTVSVGFENGNKVVAFTPGAVIKQLVKSDAKA